jgi:hypothetical protein
MLSLVEDTVRSSHPLYLIWYGMVHRCSFKSNHNFRHYGGRGIKVCARWQDFATFVEDIGPRPSDTHSLDRIDNNGNYEPGNCRWVTAKQNMRNTCRNVYIEHGGQRLCLREWSEKTGLPWYTIKTRMRRGWPPDLIFSTPLDQAMRRSHSLDTRKKISIARLEHGRRGGHSGL